jgi:large subunit ribosomal protein L25
MILSLDVTPRDNKGKTDALRGRGVVPAVLYGPKEAAISVAIDAPNFERVLKQAGQTSVVTLRGVGGDKDTLIHDVQYHPVTGKALHADFYVLEKGKKITIRIPLEFEGQAPAEKAGHILVKALHEVEIEVAPQELPKHLVVDMSKLENVGDHITAAQIQLPPSARLVTHADEIVASITEFKEEKVETPAPAPAEAAPAGEAAAPAAEAATEEKKAD